MLDVVFGQASDAGRVRPHNEDAAGAFTPRSRKESRSHGWLFAVADGVGGLELGEVASAKAIEVLTEEFAKSPEGSPLPTLLPGLIQLANSAVHDEGLQPERRGRHMATTVVACALRYDQAVISHVGDSRCYQVRDGKANLLTRDHTWVAEQRKLGLISAAEAERSEKRHMLTRSLGPELFVTADTSSVSLKPDDRLVLCTDGFYGGLYPEDIARIASQNKDIDRIARELIQYAVEVDGSDNATAQIIQVRSIEPMGMYRGRLYPRPRQ
ncbi:MAG TPA: protein phosphatase 2C domain-containing protein [Acidobacteriaceae bacterium]